MVKVYSKKGYDIIVLDTERYLSSMEEFRRSDFVDLGQWRTESRWS